MTKRATITKPEIDRAIAAHLAAGLPIARTVLTPGKFVIECTIEPEQEEQEGLGEVKWSKE